MAGTEVVNGTQLPLDAAYILNLLAGNKLTERGQTLGYNEALLNYYSRRQDAEQAWETDKARLGLDQANLNFQQRNADAQNELTRQGGVLGRDDLNFRQRSDLAGKKLGVVDMLNSRRGPSNWVRYDSLLEGLDPPKPERSATIDPFSLLDGLVKESDAFSQPNASVNQPYSGGMGAMPNSQANQTPDWLLQQPKGMGFEGGQGDGGGGRFTPGGNPQPMISNWGTPGYATNRPATNVTGLAGNDIFSGVRNEDVAGLTSGQSALKYTGTGGSSRGGDYTNFRVFDPSTGKQYGADDEIAGGTALWMTRLGRGGQMAGEMPMALVGDGTGKALNPDTEMAMALLDEAGNPVLKVLNPEKTRKAMRKGMRPKRAASGGTYGGANTTPTVEVTDYGKEALGGQGFISRLFSGRRAPAFRGLGAELSNDKIGINNAPSLLNLQAYRNLAPSQKDATAELYESGLDVDMRDILERSQRAAPWGKSFATAGYGL